MIDDPDGSIFLDTSIQIARKVHAPEIQEAIENRLRGRAEVVSGLIVREEFKRRLLKEAVYLLKQLNERKSFQKVMRHVSDNLPEQWHRKKRISLQMLNTVDEEDSDEDRYDRARLMLRALIRNGIASSEAHLSRVNAASGCACALQPIVEKVPFSRYDFGKERCSQHPSRCGIRKFLEDNRDTLQRFFDYLLALPQPGQPGGKTIELEKAEGFIARVLADSTGIEDQNPCLIAGDLLIALESIGCATMYTMNFKESQHLARVLKQSMVYRPSNSDRNEIEYLADAPAWPPP